MTSITDAARFRMEEYGITAEDKLGIKDVDMV